MTLSLNFPFRSLKKPTRLKQRLTDPILLLDIDGVLAPLHSIPESIPQHHITTNPYMNWVVREETATWLRTLHQANIPIRWASTWESDSNLLTQALNLPDISHLPLPRQVTDEWMKLAAVKKFVYAQPTDRQIVWIDDEIDDAARNWASTICNLHILVPDSRTGLTEAEMETTLQLLTTPPASTLNTDTASIATPA